MVKRKRAEPKKKKASKAVIGTGNAGTIKAKAGRYVAVFVSRLDPDTTETDLEHYIQDNHNVANKCTRLKTKYEGYSSVKVEAMCADISGLYSPVKWPAGAYIRTIF